MMSTLPKHISVVRNFPVSKGKLGIFFCCHCSSVFINSKSQRCGQNVRLSSYKNESQLDKTILQSSILKSGFSINGGKSRFTAFAQNPFPVRYVSSLYTNNLPTSYSLLLNSRLAAQLPHTQYRCIQTSLVRQKEESKVEQTVKALKEKTKQAVVPEPEDGGQDLVPGKKTLWEKFVGFLRHNYHGFRLLFIDMRICMKLIWAVLNGKTLTRREHNQLVRTTADMFRILPMLVFIIVPFAEFLLPVAIKLFPNMLPSTFQDEDVEKEKTKKKLKAKIEMAKFLQKTMEESAVQSKKSDGQTVESFGLFLEQIRKEGSKPKTSDIMKFSKLFENEITLDNLSRQQLRACCIMLGITPVGTDALLRFLLEMKLRGLLADDKMIQKEGVDSLTVNELQSANRARGMRALGVSNERLREQLKQWLQLHLVEQIPTSLILLSRALYLPETLSQQEKLTVTISKLADGAADEAKLKLGEMAGERVDNKTKLDIIKHEEQIIAAEKEQKALEEKMEEKAERERAEAKAAETVMDVQDPTAKPIETMPDEVLKDSALPIEANEKETLKEPSAFTLKDLDEMESVLAEVAKTKKIDIEVEDLKGLKEDFTEYQEDLEDLKEVAVVAGENTKHIKESKAAKHLAKKVDKMIGKLDTVLQEVKTNIQEKMTHSEQQGEVTFTQEQIDKYKHLYPEIRTNLISINEMMAGVKRLKKLPDDSKLLRIFEVLDEDKDGSIDVNHALKVLELLTHENLKLNDVQVEEITKMLKKEIQVEEEEKRIEKEKKMDEKACKEAQKKESQQI